MIRRHPRSRGAEAVTGSEAGVAGEMVAPPLARAPYDVLTCPRWYGTSARKRARLIAVASWRW